MSCLQKKVGQTYKVKNKNYVLKISFNGDKVIYNQTGILFSFFWAHKLHSQPLLQLGQDCVSVIWVMVC